METTKADDFRWYACDDAKPQDREVYYGPHPDRDAAIARGRELYKGEAFCVLRAAPAVFDIDAGREGFDLDAIFERIAERWWACDEEGLDIALPPELAEPLKTELGRTLAQFLAKHNVPIHHRILDAMRDEERIPAAKA